MARRARVSWPGGVFHVISRFARDEWWLDREGARDAYLALLGRAIQTSDVQVLAYCLMSNHVHLVVVQGAGPLERFMKSLHTGFSAWVRSHCKTKKGQRVVGTIFADRPRTTLIERGATLIDLISYIHNNPVRAGVVRFARNSAWTSHRACIGKAQPPSWLELSYLRDHFGARQPDKRFDRLVDRCNRQQRRPEFSGLAHASETASVRQVLGDKYRMGDGVLGRASFVARMRNTAQRAREKAQRDGHRNGAGRARRPTLRAVIDAGLRLLGVKRSDLIERPRTRPAAAVKRLVIWTWVRVYEGHRTELAEALALDSSIVSRYYGQAMARATDFDAQARALSDTLKRR